MAAITISKVSKAYGKAAVLQGVELAIDNGTFFTLLGPSGCGKTTLLRTIAGFISPDTGKILFDGEDVTRVPVHRRDIGMVFQDYALFPDKTVSANVAYGLRARGQDRSTVEKCVAEYLDRVGLAHLGDRYPAELSGGQRQRAALARALVIRPRVLLMDEPLSNLDAKLRVTMRETILDLQRASRTTTIFVTHDQEEALSMSDRIAILDRGVIAQVGTPEDLYERPTNAYVADFIGAANVLPVRILRAAGEDHVIAAIAGHELCCLGSGAARGGEDGKLIARPELLVLGEAEAAPGTPNVLKGQVARRQYLGARTVYTVRIGNELTITAERHAGATHQPLLAPGQPVDVVVPRTSRVVAA
ncbi:ABC transporter ATP-binding protein [Azospirillum sp. A29]|uniref:ABC transporter ATP-binding protein n=1 Tax=Azospirillum sp. A29 TaxID=3160606 RepID=UPI00366ECE7F